MPILEVLITALLFLLLISAAIIFIAAFIFGVFLNIVPMMLGGAFYAPSAKREIEKMVLISRIKHGEKAVDLGSGDGRLVIVLARAGAEAHGYEINPILVWWSKLQIKKAGLSSKAFIHRKNFWNSNLSDFSIISVFGIKHIMERLEVKLKKELKPGSRVVSNYFVFPNWKHSKKESNAYLYEVD